MKTTEPYGIHSGLSAPGYVDPGLTGRVGHLVSQATASKSQDPAEARQQMVQAGRQFEAYFVSYLLKVMRETVPEGTVTNKQGAYFYSFYDEEIGKRAAESGGIGIAKMVQEYAQQYFSSSPLEHSSSSE
ncbi:rod-binding protein [Candidatus Nitrospira nitrificans]|nr:rod-binding protein [Candidatus Nitrospira nitrificans]